MTIWKHDIGRGIHPAYFNDKGSCPFCQSELVVAEQRPPTEEYEFDFGAEIWVCKCCGWWRIQRMLQHHFPKDDPYTPGGYSHRVYGAAACLKTLNLSDCSLPLDDVRRYLSAKNDARYQVDPNLMELTVASVFRDFGYSALVTSYSGDGGIDIILNSGNEAIGVQVKRYKDRIEVEEIRSLIGAMVIGGYASGIFVTTSDFRKGCYTAADKSAAIGLPLELVSGTRLIEALDIANVKSWTDYDWNAPPFSNAKLECVSFNGGACGESLEYVWTIEDPKPAPADI